METKPYFINVSCNEMSGKQHIYNKFDYEMIDEMYKTFNEHGHPVAYNLLYKLALSLPKNRVLVTISPDPSVSASTIAGLAEKHMYGQMNGSANVPNLKILYLTSSAHLLTNYKDITIENLRNSTISNLIGAKSPSYTGNKLLLNPNQFFLLGINDNLLEDDQKEALDQSNVTYFTLSQIKKKGITHIIDYINEQIALDPLMIIFDMSSVEYETSPCVTRFLREGIRTNIKDLIGLNANDLTVIFNRINKENLVGLDITSFDFRIDSKERAYRISCEVAKLPLQLLLGIKEKRLNIFNENSKFLIYRPIVQTSQIDVGWYILRGVSLDIREQIINSISDDTIITLQIDLESDGNEETILITTTTMEEQEKKTFSYAHLKDTKITDCVLFPMEKTSMAFELLNTSENSLHT